MKKMLLNLRQFRLLVVNVLCLSGAIAATAYQPAQAALSARISVLGTPPAISSFSPNSGPFLSTVTINGTDLTGVTSVTFNNSSASFTIVSATQITATVPSGATLGKISVTSVDGTATSTTDFTPYLTWTGAANNSWDNNFNWANNILPDATTNVVINAGTTNAPIINSDAVCNNLTIGTGAALSLVSGAHLNVGGVFSNLGSYSHTAGKITFSAATGLQQVPALTYNDVTITGSGEKRLMGNTTINGTLSMEGSNLTTLDPVNTTLTLNGTITGETNDHRYIGKLVKTQAINGAVSNTFGGIGISFTNSGAGNWGNVTATRITGRSVKNPADASKQSILRYWTISPEFEVNTTVNLVLTWVDAENNSLTFPSNAAQAWRSTNSGSTWLRVDGLQPIASNGNNRSISVSTTAFSMWAVSDEMNPLPVTWLHFNGKPTASGNQLNWATASEKNSREFVVERSANGRNFEAIGTVKAGGNSNMQLNYQFTDKNAPAGQLTYYRLRQNDLDGTFGYSTIISVSGRKNNLDVVAYPNPFDGNLQLQVSNLPASQLELISLTGQQVYSKTLNASNATETISLNDMPALKPGLYLLKLTSGDQQTILKVTKN